ncbi:MULTISPECIES: TadE/TadG family type IV pilus assembly protein [Sphingomonas]|uniref:TadE/TadG family type IV pilus assembly protein n=1 Tax=Sphingomonas TaxID=13687 RepID=UPI000DEF3457|nr:MULTISPECIES: pilus assembly protein TadG-related protein [Sphingomonas]
MMSFFRKLMRNESGNTLILTALCMPLLIGSAGLATDTVEWALWKRQLQKAADSAAIAAVYARMAGQDVTKAVCYDVDPTTIPSAVRPTGCSATANTSAPNNNRTGLMLLKAPLIDTAAATPAGCTGCDHTVSVQLQVQKALPFSSMFMTSTPIITANATAAAVNSGNYCVVSLENTNTTGITAGGNTSVDFGCGMITNSTSLDAAVAFGSSSVRATPVAAVGGLDTTDNWASGTTLLPYTVAQPDPFANVNPPAIPASCTNVNLGPQQSATYGSATSGTVTCFSSLSVRGTLTLQPGTYVVTGDVNFGSQATVNCSGCTIIMTNSTPANTGSLTINGGAQVNMTAPTSGDYHGILFYQDRNATMSTTKINGNSSSNYSGAFYFPATSVEYTGTAGLTFDCVKLVIRRVTFIGNSKLNNNCPAGYYGDEFTGNHVRLVS